MNGDLKRPARTDDEDQPYFIPSSEWKGSRTGYYFGTSDSSMGTGYYQDPLFVSSVTTAVSNKKRKANTDTTDAASLLAAAEAKAADTRVVTLTPAGIRTAAAALHRTIATNTVQRAAHPDSPHQYMDSEVAVYEHVKALQAIAASVHLYSVVVSDETLVPDLMQLLLHENVDVVAAVTTVWLEWLDSDDVEEGKLSVVAELARVFLADGAEVLVENLGRTENSEEDTDDDVGRGSEDILALFLHLLELDDSIEDGVLESSSVAKKLCQETALVGWLVKQVAESTNRMGRAMELLSSIATVEDVHSVVVDWSSIPQYATSFAREEGATKDKGAPTDCVEALLQTIATFKKRQPANSDQVELLENTGLVMGSILTYSPKSTQAFLDAQGIELALRCLRERVYTASVVLKWLDFDNGDHAASRKASEHLVDAGAFKHLFPLFLGRNIPKHHDGNLSKRDKKSFLARIQNTVVRILYGFVCHLKSHDPKERKERLLAKFADGKIPRLVSLLIEYDQKTRVAEYNFFNSDIEEDLDEAMVPLAVLEAKMEAGGDVLHRLAAIAAFCCSESKSFHSQIIAELEKKDSGMGLIQGALQDFISVLQDGSDAKSQLERWLSEI